MCGHRASSERARVFFALWPPDEIREALASVANEVAAECGGRAIALPNIHLTLFFVGDIARQRLAPLEAAAESLRAAAFALTIDRLGYFRHNRIAWAGTTLCPPELEALEADLRAALAPLGVQAEDRRYVPHVTLVRKAERKPARSSLNACVWHVEELVLVESVAIRGGVQYEPLAQWPLIMAR